MDPQNSQYDLEDQLLNNLLYSDFRMPELTDEQYLYLEQLTQMGYDRMMLARLLETNPGLVELTDIIDAVDNHKFASDFNSIKNECYICKKIKQHHN